MSRSSLSPRRGLSRVIVVAVVFFLLSTVTEGSWLSLASAAAIALPLAALLTVPRLAGLRVERLPGPRVAAGEQAQTSVLVSNDGRRRSGPHVLHDDLPGHQPRRLAVPALAPGERVELAARRRALCRTSAACGPVLLTGTTPFGLFAVRRVVAVAGVVVVHPARIAVPLCLPGGGAVDRSRPVAGRGVEVLGLRPWRPGDHARSVAARASARHGRPVVLEYEGEQAGSVVVLVGRGAGPHWEAAVAVGAALAVAALHAGAALLVVGLPVAAHPTALQVLDAFAAADTADPLSAAGVGRAVALARTAGRAVLVAAPDDAGRAAALRALRGVGCPLLVADAVR